jgi:anti-sigma factor RsiW
MSPAADKQECLRFDRWLMAYVDDELDAVHVFEVEEHLEACGECTELVASLMATRSSLNVVCNMVAPSSLRERVGRTLLAEKLIDEGQLSSLEGVASTTARDSIEFGSAELGSAGSGPPVPPSATLVKLRYILPLAAAATFALVFGALQLDRQNETTSQAGTVKTSSLPLDAVASFDTMIDDLVSQHAHPAPPEETNPEHLGRFEPFIGVKVKRPRFNDPNVRWVGARMVNHRAAMLQYRVRDKRRLTVYVFDPRNVQMRGDRLHERHMGPHKVYVGSVRGYSVAATRRNGLGYVLASDLSPDDNAKLMVAVK